jgi:hypothetical protein
MLDRGDRHACPPSLVQVPPRTPAVVDAYAELLGHTRTQLMQHSISLTLPQQTCPGMLQTFASSQGSCPIPEQTTKFGAAVLA